MKQLKWVLILLNLIVAIFLFNRSVADKEQILENGTLVLLQLAPVDPRSLMQGDYMRLNYAISQDFNSENNPKKGYCVLRIDTNGVAYKVRVQKNKTPLAEGEYLIEYRYANWQLNIGAESYFFQEGKGAQYENAKYGGLKIDNHGNSILIGLYDESQKLIQ